MPKYVMYIPVYATAKFTFTSDTPLTNDEVREKMLEIGEPSGSLCHQCANDIETDWIPVEDHPISSVDVHTEDGEDDN